MASPYRNLIKFTMGQGGNKEQSEVRKVKKVEEKKESRKQLSEAERGRRQVIEATERKAVALDHEFFTQVAPLTTDFHRRIEHFETFESLAFGEDLTRRHIEKEQQELGARLEAMLEKQPDDVDQEEFAAIKLGLAYNEKLLARNGDDIGKLGDDTVNSVYRREYKGDPPRTAFVKPNFGESYFRMNHTTGLAERFQTRFNEDTQEVEEVRIPIDEISETTGGMLRRE